MSASDKQPSTFPTTQWTMVLQVIQRAGPNASEDEMRSAQQALAKFCEDYRPAVLNFFRRRGFDHHQAEDWTQEFFVSRIHSRWDQAEGFLFDVERRGNQSFRSFLSHVLRWFWIECVRKNAKMGQREQLVEEVPETGMDGEVAYEIDREIVFEVVRNACKRATHADIFVNYFAGELKEEEAIATMGVTDDTFRQQKHRFLEKLRENLPREVAKIAGPAPGDHKEEMRHCFEVLSR